MSDGDGSPASASARVVARKRLRQARWATAAFFLTLGLALGSWVARIPAVQNRLELDDAQLGISLLSVSVGAMLAMPSTGWLIRKWGNRRVMQAAATVLCLSLPLLPLAPVMPLFMLSLLVFGIGFGLLDVSMNVQAVAVEERHGLPIMSSFHGVFSIGGLGGSASAGAVAGLDVPPGPHLLVVALLLFVLVNLTSRFLLDTAARNDDAPVFAMPPRSLLGLGVLSFCVLLSEGAVADWSAVYLETVLGASAAIGAAGYAAFSLAMAAMRFGGDALALSLGPARLVGFGGLLAGLGLGGALVLGTIPATVFGFACMGAGLAASFPIALGAAGRTPGLAPGSAIGAVATLGYTGFLVGPALLGLIAESAGLRVSLMLVAALTLASALLAGKVRRPA
ncbi:MAG: MFS transporter [Chloroflexia bacterium]|nr:MFS transporter [Chloroflexia bacterium]